MKWISEMFETCDGAWCIEWEFEDGGRWRERFETKEDYDEALEKYDTEREMYVKEYEEAEHRMEVASFDRLLDMFDDMPDFLMPYEQNRVFNFIANGI